jgi:ABC-type sugar transport system substrate-binding protein
MMKKLIQFATTVGIAAAPSLAFAKDLTIGFSWNSKQEPIVYAWEKYLQSEAESQGKAAGVDIKFVFNVADNDPTRQAGNIEDLINQGVNIIMARAADSGAIGASIKAAEDADIPFLTFDHPPGAVQPTAHLGGDGFKDSKNAAEALVKLLDSKGVKGQCIELQGALTDVNGHTRHEGWLDGTKGKIETVQTIPTNWDPEIFRSGTANALRAHPEANCIFMASDFALSAVQSALEAAGRWAPEGDPKHVYIAALDVQPVGVKALREKYVDVDVTYDANLLAKKAIEVALEIFNGQKPACAPDCSIVGRIATPENIDQLPDLWSRE